jgi:hypothetical protein
MPRRGRLIVLLAALLAVAAALAPGAHATTAENRVGALLSAAGALAGADSPRTASSHRGSSTPSRPIAAGCCVATKEPMLRHYTTRRAGRAIEEDGQIVPGRSGQIWVTPDRYDSGVEAMKRLALDKEPEGFFEIPLSRLPGVTKPSRVRPANGQPGGGLECTVSCPVDVRGLPFRRIPR